MSSVAQVFSKVLYSTASAAESVGGKKIPISPGWSWQKGLTSASMPEGFLISGTSKQYDGAGFPAMYDPGKFSSLRLKIVNPDNPKSTVGLVDISVKFGEADGPSIHVESIGKDGYVKVLIPATAKYLGGQNKLQFMVAPAGQKVHMMISNIEFLK